MESLLIGVPCVLGGFDFNRRYWPHAIVVPPAGESKTRLEYSKQEIVFGVPHADAMAAEIIQFIDKGGADGYVIPNVLDLESRPTFAAGVLLRAFGMDGGGAG